MDTFFHVIEILLLFAVLAQRQIKLSTLRHIEAKLDAILGGQIPALTKQLHKSAESLKSAVDANKGE